jgi:methylated-DNA-[protein]-cysteine S-methyltransferase
MLYSFCPSPLGDLLLICDGEQLTGLYMNDPKPEPGWILETSAKPLVQASKQLNEYFSGLRMVFDLPLKPSGTPFQQRVWNLLLEIRYGETRSYGDLAKRLGNPGASRAVGLANGSNPISIIIPCHRVIGANGKLTGYGGGLPNKEALLSLERRVAGAALF